MTLKEKIQIDLIAAMKGKDELRVSTLRMLKAAVLKYEVSGNEKKVAGDDDVLSLLNKEVKQRKDSIEAFKKGGNEPMAAKEEQEMKILQEYLPAQLSSSELEKIVADTISETGASSAADFGKVMSALMPKVKGKADGAELSKTVKMLLK